MTDEPHREFDGRKFESGADTFIHAEVALEFIRFCRERGVVVLGIEGFVRNEGGVTSRLDMISRFRVCEPTWSDKVQAYAEASARMIRSILEERDETRDLYFVFSVRTRSEMGDSPI